MSELTKNETENEQQNDEEKGEYDPEAPVPIGNTQNLPEGERVVETQGVTYHLKTVEQKNLEDAEDVLLAVRAKLYRYEDTDKEWKERGTGECKILQNKDTKKIRILMRRDKIFKICANHFSMSVSPHFLLCLLLVTPQMELKPNVGNEKAWVYFCAADYADEKPKPDNFCIRFANIESMLLLVFGSFRCSHFLDTNKFKEVFEESKKIMADLESAGKA
jgi:Ran-binding protein 1